MKRFQSTTDDAAEPHDGKVVAARSKEFVMLTGGLLWLIGIPIPVILLLWFFFLRGR
ncbi:hypothetical protein HCU64_22800 [Methylobacterium sp. C25]|uniref:hypothetical protein n=1 Tax=Methylobacterium sp. C25 TaxID=2721622 RepID=UPI001F261D6F|nr:hypothetical protein [Methylobacterium sp. C25]MCE4226576.1 hypothetical protein [Methylobacterium sp. C25]